MLNFVNKSSDLFCVPNIMNNNCYILSFDFTPNKECTFRVNAICSCEMNATGKCLQFVYSNVIIENFTV